MPANRKAPTKIGRTSNLKVFLPKGGKVFGSRDVHGEGVPAKNGETRWGEGGESIRDGQQDEAYVGVCLFASPVLGVESRVSRTLSTLITEKNPHAVPEGFQAGAIPLSHTPRSH